MMPVTVLVIIALIAANLPWLSERILLVLQPGEQGKRAYWRWLEWLLLYFIVGGLGLGLENKMNGEIYPQDWEFYAVTLCLFLVFAFPGFLYRYEIRHLLKRR